MKKVLLLSFIILCSPLQASSSDDFWDSGDDVQGTDPTNKRDTWHGSFDDDGFSFSDDDSTPPPQNNTLLHIFTHWPQHEDTRLPYDGLYIEDSGLEDKPPTCSMIGSPQHQTELIKIGFCTTTTIIRKQTVMIKKPDHQQVGLTFTWEPQMPHTWTLSIACDETKQILRKDQSSYEKDNPLMVRYDLELLRFVFDEQKSLPKIHLLWPTGDEAVTILQEIMWELIPITPQQ